MKEKPVFSVIIPSVGNTNIYKTICSVILQTFNDFEILIVFDGDNTQYISTLLRELASHEKIEIFKNFRDKGGNGARNSGILKAKGQYICFLDDDDIWHKDRLERVLPFLKGSDDSMAGCITGFNYWNGKELQKHSIIESKEMAREFLLQAYNFGNSSNFILKKEAISTIGLWDENLKRHQDYEYFLRILRYFKLLAVNEVLLTINGHSTQPSSEVMLKSKINYFYSIKDYLHGMTPAENDQFFGKQYHELLTQTTSEGRLYSSLSIIKKILRKKNYRLSSYQLLKIYFKILLFPLFRIRFILHKKYSVRLFYKRKFKNAYKFNLI